MAPSLTHTPVAQLVSTTTLFTDPTDVPIVSPHKSSNSGIIAPIVGGVVGGVLLAIAAVLAWHWWGKSIKHKEAEKKREALAFLKVRENTRKNAQAALEKGHADYVPPSTLRAERTVKFSSSSAESNQSTVKSYMSYEKEKDHDDAVMDTPPAASRPISRIFAHAPARPSPLAKSATAPPVPPPRARHAVPPPAARRTPSPESDDQPTELPSQIAGLKVPPLVHKTSKASSMSVYSTQSGEEHQQLVPPSLIMAAFRRPDPRRPLVDRRSAAPSAYSFDEADTEHNRLSNISAGSVYLQHASDTDLPSGDYIAR
ncbi:hypothetical protein BDW22DRAFT_1431181 [Trametopsis cervina]|nr:hypothetical protein BDW22DRAFT_1431181 [Trametopsis cervina]